MSRHVAKLNVACLLAALAASAAIAQEADQQPEAEPDSEPVPEILPVDDVPALATAEEAAVAEDLEAVEEIIVIAPRPGSRRGPIAFDDPERARLLRELYQSREDQEELARLAALADEQDRRIRLGYNPDLERPPSLDEQMATPQRETTQPATIFTIQF